MTNTSLEGRYWPTARAKLVQEGRCRIGEGCEGPLQAAHTIGRKHDPIVDGKRFVRPDDIVPLCRAHHLAYDDRALDLLPYLSHLEQAAAVEHVGIMSALRRLSSSRDGA